MVEIKFTRHALEKFRILEEYRFKVSKEAVIETLQKPTRIERRNEELFALKAINEKH